MFLGGGEIFFLGEGSRASTHLYEIVNGYMFKVGTTSTSEKLNSCSTLIYCLLMNVVSYITVVDRVLARPFSKGTCPS